MGESIESFVAKLKAEGVDAGRAEADALKANAEAEAKRIVEAAKAEAEAIVSKARVEADGLAARTREDLRIAARDAQLSLRQKLTQILIAVLQGEVKSALGDLGFVKKALEELVAAHLKSEANAKDIEAQVTVDKRLAQPLAEWAQRELNRQRASATVGVKVDVEGTLRSAGFEFRTSGGTIEVTEESVLALLKEIVAPAIRELLDKAAKDA